MRDDKDRKEPTPLSLSEFMKAQSAPAFLATIEELKDRPDDVKVTPWIPQGGCLCHAALEVPKDSIKTVTPTDDTHFCCGKVLRVGEVQFKPGAKMDLEKVFAQIMQSVAGGGGHAAAHGPFPHQ